MSQWHQPKFDTVQINIFFTLCWRSLRPSATSWEGAADIRFQAGCLVVVLVTGLFFAPLISAQSIDFVRDVQPIFAEHCLHCHGPDVQESGYRLDVREIALRGGDLYPQLVNRERPAASPLLAILSGKDEDVTMPPDDEPLSRAELRTIRRWIEEGAHWPDAASVQLEPEQPLWSLTPPRRFDLSADATSRGDGLNPVDLWIAAKHCEVGLDFSPTADDRTLVRRLYLVVTGLPPSWEQVRQFMADRRSDKYERLVDELLASPRFGERWAQLWLDAVRFAESDGFETNHERPNAWHYRDWVIRAFNDDLPYDQFVRRQIAGDQFGDPAATGFIVAGTHDIVKGEDEDLNPTQRLNELADMVNTTGTAFLGLTVGCARCHNHKFDPISQTDYYAMQAVFAGVQHGEREVAPADLSQRLIQIDSLQAELGDVETALLQYVRPPVTHTSNVDNWNPTAARFLRFTIQRSSSAEPCIDEMEIFSSGDDSRNVALASAGTQVTSSGNYAGSPDIHRLEFIHDGVYGNSHSWIASTASDSWVQFEFPELVVIDSMVWSRDRSGQPNSYSDRLAIEYTVELSLDGLDWRRVASSQDRLGSHDLTVLIPEASDGERRTIAEHIAQLSERRLNLNRDLASLRTHPTIYAGRFEDPPPTFRLHRGEHRLPRETVRPQSLSAFANITGRFELADDATNAERRVALARWLTQTDNPLPARVIVNRLWQGVFGTGLVATPSDFGNLGARPSHPELLDVLACDFVEQGWSMKRLLRLLLTSKTFRQSSQPRTEGLNLDANSRLLWRYPPQRMSAEMIRDSLLSTSGSLDLTAGGPGFLLFEPNNNYARNWVPKTVFEPTDYRRMIYALKIRMEPDAVFSTFDVPDGGQVCPQRPMSITPIQALNLFNSQFVIDEAHRLAGELTDESSSVEGQIEKAFMRVLLRPPDDVERQWAAALATEHSLAAAVRALINSNEFLWIE